MTNSKKIYIKAYTRINLGDDLFIHILCSRYPNVTFYLKAHKNFTDIFKDIKNLIIQDDFTNIKFDANVYIGGSIFIESAPTSCDRVLDLKDEIIKENTPTFIIGANFGPYKTEKYFNTVKNEIIKNVKSITFRDKYSYNLFKDLPNVHYAPDTVFTLDTSNFKKINTNEIGISLIHHLERENLKQNYEKYLNTISNFAKHYINKGFNIRLFSFCEYEKDLIAINLFKSKFNEEELKHIFTTDYQGDINTTLSEINNLNCFITTRFHATILGIKLDVPVIPICYSNKTINVLEDLDFPNENIYTFNNIENLDYSISEIFKTEIIKDAIKQFEDLDKHLKNNL